MEELAARLIDPFIRVRTKVIPLRLKKIRGQTFLAISVIKCQ
jgi:hypothetical protein